MYLQVILLLVFQLFYSSFTFISNSFCFSYGLILFFSSMFKLFSFWFLLICCRFSVYGYHRVHLLTCNYIYLL